MVVSTEPAVSATAPRPVRVPWSIWGLSAIVVLGAFTSMLFSTIATVALPGIARDLHTSSAAAQWATTGYLLALAAGVPLSGWAARRLGPSRLWLLSLGLFGAFSVVCATAGTIEVLIAGRVLQGLAGGLLVPAGQTSPAVFAIVRPSRHRVPVLRLIPTSRHASPLLTPCAINRTNRSCFSVNARPACVIRDRPIATSA